MTEQSGTAGAVSTAPRAPTAELLVLFWPEMFGIGTARRGAAVPGRDTCVEPRVLAPRLLGAVLADLAAQGLVSLEVVMTKVVLVTRRHVAVTRTGAGGPVDGFAGQLLRQVAGTAKVRKVVRGWFGEDVADPFGHVAERVASEGHVLGYYLEEQQQQGRVSAALRRRPKVTYRPILERVGPTREAAVALAARLQAFAQASPSLIPMLEHDIASAIASRRESDSDSDSGGDAGGDFGGGSDSGG